MKTSPSQEYGSILIWILVAVVLLAGLTTVINQGSRTSTGMLSEQQARLAAAEIISYSNTVRQAVQRMQMQGISEVDFDFSNDVYKRLNGMNLTAPNGSCAANACRVFHPEGGGIIPVIAPEAARVDESSWSGNAWRSGHAGFRIARVAEAGTDLPDLIMQYTSISLPVCLKINELLGVDNPSGMPPTFYLSAEYVTNYSGTITTIPIPSEDSLNHEAINGKTSFCVSVEVGLYHFFITLLAR